MFSQVEIGQLEAARSGDQQQFSELAEPYRKELQAYCYRLLGSLQDAEDVVQETMLRAWRRLETFEGRASFRAWLYKIATNAALDVLDHASRRALPITLYAPVESYDGSVNTIGDPIWLDPFPDEWLDEIAISAEAHYTLQESVTLAFLTVLQVLPSRQRAVLVLSDVLDWRANEVALLLEMTPSAVKSALHRARVSLSKHELAALPENTALPSSSPHLLERYMRVWEEADVSGLVSLLKEDATFNMPPSSTWFQGREAIGEFFASSIFANGLSYRLQPIRASGQPGFAAYLYDHQIGNFQAHAIHVLTLDDGLLMNLTAFLNPALFLHFHLPLQMA